MASPAVESPQQQGRRRQSLQTSFLAPDESAFFAQLTCLRHLLNEVTAARYGRQPCRADPQVVIRSPRDVANLLLPEMEELAYEEFRVVLLTSKNAVIDVPILYKGTLNSATVRIAEVFKAAIIANAASIIAVHCHPSGDPTPSPEDVRTTAEIVKAGALLDIECLDHIIFGHGTFVSLKERGLGF